jgi:protein-S-isoprenylcysteine O-methyltransferase Ste14
MTDTQMYAAQNLLRVLAAFTGMIVIVAPQVSIQIRSRNARGRSIGSGSWSRRWPAALLITIGFLTMGVILWKPLPIHLYPSSQHLLTWIGFAIYFPAVCLYFSGFIALGRYFRVSSSQGADLYAEHQLVRKGPYRFIRHPMYLAVILAAVGAFLLFRTWAMLVFLPMSTVVLRRATQEEKLLALEFGEEYWAYVRQVPGWFPRFFRKNNSS